MVKNKDMYEEEREHSFKVFEQELKQLYKEALGGDFGKYFKDNAERVRNNAKVITDIWFDDCQRVFEE